MAEVFETASGRTDEAAAFAGDVRNGEFCFFTGRNTGEDVHQTVFGQIFGIGGDQRRDRHQHHDIIETIRRIFLQFGVERFRRSEILRIEQFEHFAVRLGDRAERFADMVQAVVVHIGDDDRGRSVGIGNRQLSVHLSHGSGAAGQPDSAALFERAADIAVVGGGKVRASGPLIEPALIMDAADVERPVFIIFADKADAGVDGPHFGGLFAFRTVGSAQEDIVELGVRGQGGGAGHFSLRIDFCDLGSEGGRSFDQRDFRRGVGFQHIAEFITRRFGTEEEQHFAAGFRGGAVLDRVAGQHAGPRFEQGGDHRRDGIVQRKQIAAFIAVEHFLVDDAVLGITAVQGIAVGPVHAFHVDIGLDDVALTDFILAGKFAADFRHGHDRFMARDHRIFLEVFGFHARMFFPGADQFDIGEAKSYRIDFHQQFIVCDFRQRKHGRLIVFTEIFETGAEHAPCQNLFRQFIALAATHF